MSVHSIPFASELLNRALLRHSDRIALKWDGGEWTYRAVHERIGRLQAAVLAKGLKRGQRLFVLAGNSADAWCSAMAAQACGLGVSWLHPLGSVDDHLFQLQNATAEALVIDPATHRDHAAVLLHRLSSVAAGSQLRVFTLSGSEFGEDLARLADTVGSYSMTIQAEADDLAVINYTGGTTGQSKGVIHVQKDMAAMTRTILASFELPARPNYLACAPISHVAGTLMPPVLLRGGTIRLLERFSPTRVLQLVQEERLNSMLLVPTMISALLDDPILDKADLSSIDSVIYGASPIAPTRLEEGLRRFGPVFCQLYGQSEGYPLTYLPKSNHVAGGDLLGSCGAATHMASIALLDVDDQPVADGEVGEICARAPFIMQGYLGRDDLTADALRNGWLHTGDMARRDERGYYWIMARKKDLIVTGGFNVYPKEVEDALGLDPAVADVAVIGTPDPKWGEAVTAIVVRKPGEAGSNQELVARLTELVRSRKGSVQTPKLFEFVESLPKTALGKIDKQTLRAPFWAGQTRQVA